MLFCFGCQTEISKFRNSTVIFTSDVKAAIETKNGDRLAVYNDINAVINDKVDIVGVDFRSEAYKLNYKYRITKVYPKKEHPINED